MRDDVTEVESNGVCSPKTDDGVAKCKGGMSSISLPPFGLATYKMQGNLWINHETTDQERIISLLSAADSWLKQLRLALDVNKRVMLTAVRKHIRSPPTA
ncbi:hypothetical protein ACLOJK_017047, partial [Asimina triloba]